MPTVGTLARRGRGWYETWTDAAAGETVAKWVATGSGEATVIDSIVVDAAPF